MFRKLLFLTCATILLTCAVSEVSPQSASSQHDFRALASWLEHLTLDIIVPRQSAIARSNPDDYVAQQLHDMAEDASEWATVGATLMDIKAIMSSQDRPRFLELISPLVERELALLDQDISSVGDTLKLTQKPHLRALGQDVLEAIRGLRDQLKTNFLNDHDLDTPPDY